MKQLKKYCVGMLLLVTLLFATACGSSKNDTVAGDTGDGTATDGTTGGDNSQDGPNIDDVLFDTDGDGVYDHTDVDGDGLLEEIGGDSNDVMDDLVDDMTGDDESLGEDGVGIGDGAEDGGNGTVTP